MGQCNVLGTRSDPHAEALTERDPVDSGPDEHTSGRYDITGVHTGPGSEGERAWHAPHHDPSRPCRMAVTAVLAMEPAGHETSEATECEGGRFSKIRARPPVRNHLLSTARAADGRASATCEQQVVYRKGGHTPRHYPLSQRRGSQLFRPFFSAVFRRRHAEPPACSG